MVGAGWRLAGLISAFLGQTPSRGHLDLLHKMYTQMGDRLSEISPTFAPSFFLSLLLSFLLSLLPPSFSSSFPSIEYCSVKAIVCLVPSPQI